jgi:hypothetical protein
MGALAEIYKALRERLTRSGVPVGGTAMYPRIEIHSLVESAALDKDGSRQVTCIVECISNRKMHDVQEMQDENLRRMLGNALQLGENWQVFGIVAGQVQEMTEISDTNAIIYRLLQNVTIYVERING